MMIKILRLSLLFFLIIIGSEIKAQYNDAALWTSLEAGTTVYKKWDLRGELGYRINNNYQQTDKFYIETGIQYKINKYLRLAGEYRFVQKYISEDLFYADRHRLQTKLRFSNKVNRLRFNWTGKYQIKVYDHAEHNFGNTKMLSHIRNKFQIKYKIKGKGLYPYIFYESFTPLNAGNIFRYSIETHRLGGGTEFKFNKRNRVKLFFIYERELHDTELINTFISGINYSFSF